MATWKDIEEIVGAKRPTAQAVGLHGLVSCDRIGWDAIQHKDGWWVGTEKGVTCYADHDLARAALTIIWQAGGGKELNFRIKPFTGAHKPVGEYRPAKSALDALRDYEAKAANADISDRE